MHTLEVVADDADKALECGRCKKRIGLFGKRRAINELKSQKRSYYNGLDELYKTYWETGKWTVKPESMQLMVGTPPVGLNSSGWSSHEVIDTATVMATAAAVHLKYLVKNFIVVIVQNIKSIEKNNVTFVIPDAATEAGPIEVTTIYGDAKSGFQVCPKAR